MPKPRKPLYTVKPEADIDIQNLDKINSLFGPTLTQSEIASASIVSAHELSKDELAGIYNQNGDAKSAEQVMDADFAFIIGALDKESIRINHTGRIQLQNFSRFLEDAIPRRRREQIKRAQSHFEHDDLLGDLIRVKHDFTTSGLSLQATPPSNINSTDDEQNKLAEFQSVLNDLSYSIDIFKLIDDLLYDYYITDSMILYWRTDGASSANGIDKDDSTPKNLDSPLGIPGIYDICALSPGEVDWDNSLGRDILAVDIPLSIRDLIKNALRGRRDKELEPSDPVQALLDAGIGMKWIEAVNKNKDQVILRRDDGDNWIIRTRQRKHHGLCNPSMKSIFVSLEMRKMLIDGDFSAAFMMKHFIMLIKQGESIESGPLAGQTKNWLTQKDANDLMKKFANVAKAMRIAVNHTTKIEFIFPPKEMFNEEKYQQSEKRIFNWVGVVQSLMTGTGQNYGGGFLGIKKLIAQIGKARRELNIMFHEFFNHETVREKISTPEKYTVSTNFDSNILTEPAQLLKEVEFLYKAAISDQRTAARELGRNPDTLKASTLQSQKEQKSLKIYDGIGAQATYGRGRTTVDRGGRPANPGTTPNEETRNQPPSTS